MSNWREVTTRLVADTQVLAGALAPDQSPPNPDEAADLLIGVHHLIEQAARASIGIGRLYGQSLPEDVLGRFRQAAHHLRNVSLLDVADELRRAPHANRDRQPKRT